MKNRLYKIPLLLLAVALITGACSKFHDKTDYSAIEESEKDLSGTWKIFSATRNGQDISKMMDFTKFSLHLNSDGSYSMDNYLPFMVQKSGQWAIDDPRFPFTLSFTESGSSTPVSTELYYPVVDGKRRINLTFSPGCYSNTYTYVFISESNEP